VLGCTHYPLIKRVIGETMRAEVTLVDSAEATAKEASQILEREGLLNQNNEEVRSQFYVTDAAKRFHRIAERILGEPLDHLEAVEVWGHDRLKSD